MRDGRLRNRVVKIIAHARPTAIGRSIDTVFFRQPIEPLIDSQINRSDYTRQTDGSRCERIHARCRNQHFQIAWRLLRTYGLTCYNVSSIKPNRIVFLVTKGKNLVKQLSAPHSVLLPATDHCEIMVSEMVKLFIKISGNNWGFPVRTFVSWQIVF